MRTECLGIYAHIIAISLAAFATSESHAATFSWSPANSSIVKNASSLQQTVNGVTVTAQGYTAEVSGSDASVFGPFPTGTAANGRPAFGVDVRGLGAEQLGLIAQPLTGIAVSGSDWGGGGVQPGFDSFPYRSGHGSVVKFDFAAFSFDGLVDIPSVTVDDTSNFGRVTSGWRLAERLQTFPRAFSRYWRAWTSSTVAMTLPMASSPTLSMRWAFSISSSGPFRKVDSDR